MSRGERRRAVFLDRDGTINHDTNYLSSPHELRLIPGADRAIARLNAAGLWVVVVTNQSGLARGYFGERDLEAVHAELQRLLSRAGARIDAFYHCPHLPPALYDSGPPQRRGRPRPELIVPCECRKPAPGLVLRAARELGIELAGSFLVGDRPGDIACGRAAGLTCVRVATGPDASPPSGPEEVPHHQAPDLAAAVDWILARLQEGAR